MDLTRLLFFKILNRCMDWLNERQRVLAQNIANADTPNYKPRDLRAFEFEKMIRLEAKRLQPKTTHSAHIERRDHNSRFRVDGQRGSYETNLSGNSVVFEEQLLKVNKTSMDYDLATKLYKKHIGLFRIALGRSGN